MTRFFERGTAFAEMERQMMMVPDFAPRGYGSAVLCRYRPTAADVDCRNCLEHRRRGCRSLTCLYLSERLEAGAVSMEELIAETVRPWKHLPLKQRAMGQACRTEDFHFEGRLHIMRMMEMTNGENGYINSRWLAAVYLLSAHAALWQKTITAVRPDQIDFASVRLGDCTIQDYVLYRAAKGTCSGTLGATSEELDYLAKRLDSFCGGEDDQFLGMAHKLDLTDIKDFINLTFCCRQATVITNFSDLQAIGRAHYMNIHGGCAVGEELANLDGCEAALLLIDSGAGVVTPYGVVYDNGMKLEPLYDGRHFPSYLYKSPVIALETVSGSGAEGYFCLPMPDRQLQRAVERTGLERQRVPPEGGNGLAAGKGRGSGGSGESIP